MLVLCIEITTEQKIHNLLGITNGSIQIGLKILKNEKVRG